MPQKLEADLRREAEQKWPGNKERQDMGISTSMGFYI